MKILRMTPSVHSGGERFPCIAYFDVEVSDGIRLYGLRLLRSRDGRHLSYAPSAGGKRCATFAPDIADQITAAATAALEGRAAYDHST